MKIILFTITLLAIIFPCLSQDCPVLNDKEAIGQHHVKSISIKFNSISDLKEHDSLEVVRVEFDENGNITFEKYFRLFDVILYSEEYQYVYSNSGLLVEKIKTQLEYPRTKQDSSYLEIVGYGPSTTKWTYDYDHKNQLVKELEYLDADDKNPTLSTTYGYDKKGNKTKAVFKNINNPQQTSLGNRIELYEYDKNDRLIKVKMNWTTIDVNYVRTVKFNEQGQKVYESLIHNGGERGNTTRYKYDQDRLSSTEIYMLNEKEWSNKTIFQYSEDGCLSKEISQRSSGAEWIKTFECNDKGLLKSEYWYNKEGEKAFYFETEYLYY